MQSSCPAQETLDAIFPPERTNAFFEALFGDADDGAYDIGLICRKVTDNKAIMAFELRCRPGQCLRCNLTSGLPHVFQRHPIINAQGVARDIASALGWTGDITWSLGATEEASSERHYIPFIIERSAAN